RHLDAASRREHASGTSPPGLRAVTSGPNPRSRLRGAAEPAVRGVRDTISAPDVHHATVGHALLPTTTHRPGGDRWVVAVAGAAREAARPQGSDPRSDRCLTAQAGECPPRWVHTGRAGRRGGGWRSPTRPHTFPSSVLLRE